MKENLLKPLDTVKRALLERELKRPDLQIFSAVRMARQDLLRGDYDMALCRIRSDSDKLHDEHELYALIRYYFD